jgi:hypothetical protein
VFVLGSLCWHRSLSFSVFSFCGRQSSLAVVVGSCRSSRLVVLVWVWGCWRAPRLLTLAPALSLMLAPRSPRWIEIVLIGSGADHRNRATECHSLAASFVASLLSVGGIYSTFDKSPMFLLAIQVSLLVSSVCGGQSSSVQLLSGIWGCWQAPRTGP